MSTDQRDKLAEPAPKREKPQEDGNSVQGTDTIYEDESMDDRSCRRLADDLLCYALEQQFKHRLASSFFHSRYIWWSLLPSAALTLICGVTALVSEAASASTLTAVTTGVAAALSTFLQAFASTLRYNSRSDMHSTASMRFEEMVGKLERAKIYSEEDVDCQNSSKRKVPKTRNFQQHKFDVERLEQRIEEVTSSCSSAIPSILEGLFASLNIRFVGEIRDLERAEDKGSLKVDYNEVKRMTLRSLFAHVRMHKWWRLQPWWPGWSCAGCVDKAIDEVKEHLTVGDALRDIVVNPGSTIQKRQENSL